MSKRKSPPSPRWHTARRPRAEAVDQGRLSQLPDDVLWHISTFLPITPPPYGPVQRQLSEEEEKDADWEDAVLDLRRRGEGRCRKRGGRCGKRVVGAGTGRGKRSRRLRRRSRR